MNGAAKSGTSKSNAKVAVSVDKRWDAVLFDYARTLFAPREHASWIREAAVSIGLRPTREEIEALDALLTRGFEREDYASAAREQDRSMEAHQAAFLLAFQECEQRHEGLGRALYDRFVSEDNWVPYSDTATVLRRLSSSGVRIGIVSNIGWDVRPAFVRHGLYDYVTGWSLSYEHGAVKPETEAFMIGLRCVGSSPARAIMVGDSPIADGGASAVGLLSIVLPPAATGGVRGLGSVVDLVRVS